MGLTLTKNVLAALLHTGDELEKSEGWAESASSSQPYAARIASLMIASSVSASHGTRISLPVRVSAIKALAYMPARHRIATILEVSCSRPDVLNALFDGPLTPEAEACRYNVVRSLGVFARNGLAQEVFTVERTKRASELISSIRAHRGGR